MVVGLWTVAVDLLTGTRYASLVHPSDCQRERRFGLITHGRQRGLATSDYIDDVARWVDTNGRE